MKNASTLLLLVGLLCGATGCSDILEQKPLANPTTESFYTNETESTLAVNAIYDPLGSTDLYKVGSIALAMMEDHLYKATPAADGPGMSEISEFNLDPNNAFVTGWYRTLYIGIDRANVAIQKLPAVPETGLSASVRKRLIAEAKFLRGLYYFHLVRLFGDVPLVLESAASPDAPGVAKSAEAAVWAQVEKDFSEAIPDLPVRYGAADAGRATSGAARAFLAQAFLWQKKHSSALPLLDEVVKTGGFGLRPNYVDLFLEANDNNAEVVFAVGFRDNGTGNFSGSNENALFSKYVGVRGTGNQIHAPTGQPGFGFIMATDKFLTRYEPGDKRRDVTVWELGKLSPATGKPYSAQAAGANGRYRTDVAPMKWWWNNQGYNGNISLDFTLMRYADVLLLQAETINELSGPTAAAYAPINLVRKRAGLPDLKPGLTKTEFFEAVLKERAVEFGFECVRWWDLARTRTADQAFKGAEGKAAFDPKKHYKWPLPQQALERNPALKQNPAYGG